MLAIRAACIVSSFAIGIHTAGDVTPVSLIEAGGIPSLGDMDGNGVVDISDAITILEIAQGYREATVDQRKADPNGDGALTADDAIRVLSTLSLR